MKYITIYRKREKKTLYEHFNRYRKAFDNTEHTGMIKNSYKGKNKSQCLESDKEYLSRKKELYQTAHILMSWKHSLWDWKCNRDTRKLMCNTTTSSPHWTKVLASIIKKIKWTIMWKEEMKFSLFADNIIIHKKHSKFQCLVRQIHPKG